jgi:hypothetical protein
MQTTEVSFPASIHRENGDPTRASSYHFSPSGGI